ncbi:Unknown protein, partial [Striga hermonthica]
ESSIMTRRDIWGWKPTRYSVFLRRNLGLCIAVPWTLYALSSYFLDLDGNWKRNKEENRVMIKKAMKNLDIVRKMREETEHSVM